MRNQRVHANTGDGREEEGRDAQPAEPRLRLLSVHQVRRGSADRHLDVVRGREEHLTAAHAAKDGHQPAPEPVQPSHRAVPFVSCPASKMQPSSGAETVKTGRWARLLYCRRTLATSRAAIPSLGMKNGKPAICSGRESLRAPMRTWTRVTAGMGWAAPTRVHLAGSCSRGLSRRERRRRSALEPKSGHLKNYHRVWRCFLKGVIGDAINIALAAAGASLRKLLGRLSFLPCAGGWLTARHFRCAWHRHASPQPPPRESPSSRTTTSHSTASTPPCASRGTPPYPLSRPSN